MSDLVRLTGLWVNESKDGKKYMAGNLGMARVMVFKNDHKEKDSDPDYVLLLGAKENRDQPQEEEIPF